MNVRPLLNLNLRSFKTDDIPEMWDFCENCHFYITFSAELK
jgi:hypothetical protein